MLVTDLSAIIRAAENNEEKNLRFREILQQTDSTAIDDLVFKLNEIITPQIDCTQCGNCCRSLMINVDATDAQRLADYLNISQEAFEEKFIEHSTHSSLAVMNKIPCHFLKDNKCTVYQARPTECREFPGLHRAGFTKRLFATFMHYSRCPIIFNVIEALKKELMHTSETNEVQTTDEQ